MHVHPERAQCAFGCDADDAIQHYLVCPRLQHHVCLPRAFSHDTVLARIGLGDEGEYERDDSHEKSMWATMRRLVLSYYMYLEMKNGPERRRDDYSAHLSARRAALDRLDMGGNRPEFGRTPAPAVHQDLPRDGPHAAPRGLDASVPAAPHPAVVDGQDNTDIDTAVSDGLDLNTFDTAFDAVADGVDNDFM
eukprot:8688218-Pyramimonas_sp.AAC.1